MLIRLFPMKFINFTYIQLLVESMYYFVIQLYLYNYSKFVLKSTIRRFGCQHIILFCVNSKFLFNNDLKLRFVIRQRLMQSMSNLASKNILQQLKIKVHFTTPWNLMHIIPHPRRSYFVPSPIILPFDCGNLITVIIITLLRTSIFMYTRFR